MKPERCLQIREAAPIEVKDMTPDDFRAELLRAANNAEITGTLYWAELFKRAASEIKL